MAEEGFAGRCACGAVRFAMKGRPIVVHACHCSECQRLSGAAFAVNAVIETDRVDVLAGELGRAPVVGTSGKEQTILRCPACRVALWSHYPTAGERVAFVRVGTLEEPGRLPPDIHIFTSTRLPWLPLPEDVRAVPEFYSPREVWPAESLERWRRAMGG